MWENLVACYHPDLSRYILKHLIQANLVSISVSDIEQKTWETAWQRFSNGDFQWRGVSAVYRWLFSTALNHIRNASREAYHRELRLTDPSDYSEQASRVLERSHLPLVQVSVPGPEEILIDLEEEREQEKNLYEKQQELQEKAGQLHELFIDYNTKKVQIYILAEVYGLKPRQIAHQLKIKDKTVRDYLYQMRAAARKIRGDHVSHVSGEISS
jgi:RNA polymerase sigma factor (sigma-70 family)